MFSSKKPERPQRRHHDLSQFGFTDIPDDFDPAAGIGGDGSDSDLEAELAAIAGGGAGRVKSKPKPKILPPSELDRMIAESLRDIGSDEELSADDERSDSDLLAELNIITGGDLVNEDVEATALPEASQANASDEDLPKIFLATTTVDMASVIRERIEMYKQAESAAKAAAEAAKVRRFNRGLKTLTDLLKQASAGKPINADDIPPVVSVKQEAKTNTDDLEGDKSNLPSIVPSRTAPSVPDSEPTVPPDEAPSTTPAKHEAPVEPNQQTVSSSEESKNPIIEQLQALQKDYKVAALNYKRSGDTANALQFLKVVKQFDVVIKMCAEGQEVDLSDMPPPPDQFLEFMAKMQAAAASANNAEVVPVPSNDTAEIQPNEPISATSILEALQQRLEKYKSVEEAAKAEGNSSKARRFGRIVKQYEDAIKQHKAGRSVAYDELPVPPGFAPLPTVEGNESTKPSPPIASSEPTSPGGDSTSSPGTQSTHVASPKQELTTRTSGNQQANNLAEQQMKILLQRQNEFKVAAIEAKRAGEIDQAKEYLKIFKGFDALLNAASSGLPVDLSTLPVPPSQRDNLEASFAIVTTDDCDPNDDISDISIRIEEQLAKQLMMCKNTRDHHKAMGDIAGMNRFENLALTVQKDLDLVRYSKRKNFALPKFHYEKKSFNIVHCNTDLTDNELEIVVVRGITYNVNNPKDVDTYVKVEFPLLNDEVYKTKTSIVRDTESPDYDQRFKLEIMRGNRQFQRIFKRHGIKFEVYSRGGFLRSDVLIGTVNVKLQPLETKCEIHDTFDLMEGRKSVGGKLEIKIRVRNPILTKQIEHLNEKWLVLDA